MTTNTSWYRRLKDRLEEELQHAPQLARETRAEKRARRPSIITIVLVVMGALFAIPMLGLVFPLMFLFGLEKEEPAFAAVVVSGFLLTVASLAIAEILLMILYRSKGVSVFSHLPVNDSHIARDRWKLVMLFTLPGVWYLVNVNLGILRGYWSTPWAWPAGIAMTIIQWGFTLGLGTWLAYRFPRWPHGKLASASFLIALVFLYLPDPVKKAFAADLMLVCPGGWCGAALWGMIYLELPWIWLAAIPALVVTLLLPKLVTAFSERFQCREFTIHQRDDVRLEFGGFFAGAARGRVIPSIELEEGDEDEPLETSEEEVRTAWQSLRGDHDWIQRVWVERLTAVFLTEREQNLVSFLTGNVTYWTTVWRWIFGFLALIALMMAVGILPFSEECTFLIFLPFFYGILFQMLLDNYPGFRMTDCSGTHVAHQIYYPLSTGELSKVFLKLAAIKAAVTTCILSSVVLILQVVFLFEITAIDLLLIALGLFSAYLVVYIWRLSVHLSAGLAFPRLRWTNFWRPLITIFLFVGTSFSFILFVAFSTLKSPLLISGLLATWLCSLLNWWFMKRMVDRNVIDLLGSKLSWLDQAMNSNKWQTQRLQTQMKNYERLRKKYGTFWWLRRPFG